MFRIKKLKKWLKNPHIKHPKRWDRAFIITRLITTCEGLYIILTPAGRAISGLTEANGHHVPDAGTGINVGLGVGFTIISEVIIITMQRIVFKNRQVLQKKNALLD